MTPKSNHRTPSGDLLNRQLPVSTNWEEPFKSEIHDVGKHLLCNCLLLAQTKKQKMQAWPREDNGAAVWPICNILRIWRAVASVASGWVPPVIHGAK